MRKRLMVSATVLFDAANNIPFKNGIIFELKAFQAGIIFPCKADDLCGHVAEGVKSFGIILKIDPLDIQCPDLIGLVRGDLFGNHDKSPFLGQVFF